MSHTNQSLPSLATVLVPPPYSHHPPPILPRLVDYRPIAPASSPPIQTSTDDILAEKRRRNAGASARFRDRRKQREKETQEKCERLEKRLKDLEKALARADATAAAVLASADEGKGDWQERTGMKSKSLAGGVHELESLVERMKGEKEKDKRTIEELKKENAYLRSLINSCSTTSPTSPPESQLSPENVTNTRSASPASDDEKATDT